MSFLIERVRYMNKVEYEKMINRYKECGCENLKFKSTDDIKSVLNIDVEKIKGFESLKIGQGMFKKFIVNFLNGIGISERVKIKPLSVRIVKHSDGAYIRFDYMNGSFKGWLHVKGSNNFY